MMTHFSDFLIQVRFCMKFLTKEKELPSRKEMLQDTDEEMEKRWAKGYKKRQAHMMGPVQVSYFTVFIHLHCVKVNDRFVVFSKFKQNEYYEDLSKTAGIENLKPVITKLHNDSSLRFLDDLVNFRKDVYRIIDDETFIKVKG